MKKVELLAPAGDLEKLKIAIIYGADAVYLAGKNFGLRTASKNFSIEQIEEGVKFVHSYKKRVYVTMNIIPHNKDFEGIQEYIKALKKIGVDALIVADAGIYRIIREISKDFEVHLSTQASVTNYETVKFWQEQGIKRVVLARELSLDEIKEIKEKCGDIILEAFVHGAMCISYSGRCLLSNYMCNRDANLGDCAQACRWKYSIVEEKRPGEYYPIEEDDTGTYIFNSKDLCTIDIIPELIEAGIDSLKIEGRVKSSYYVATVVRSYRMIIDSYYDNSFSYEKAEKMLDEIKKVSYRDYTEGFYLEKPSEKAQNYKDSSYIRKYDFVGLVLDYDEKMKIATVEQRNKIFKGDLLECFGPYKEFKEFKVDYMTNENGEDLDSAPRAQEIIKIKIDFSVRKWDMLRKRIEE